MGNPNYRRGANAERRYEAHMRRQGWVITRTPNSGGGRGFDILAARQGEVLVAEVKATPTPFTKFPPDDRRHVKQLAEQAGGRAGRAVLVWFPPGKPFVEIPSERWPSGR